MFCSLNASLKSNFSSFLTTVSNSCVAEVANLICFSCFLYILLLLLLYVQWSPLKHHRGISETSRLLRGHDIRHTLMTITLILHLTELGDLIVTNERSWFTKLMPGIAFVSIIVCQIFYNKLEQYGKYNYLIVTSIYWMCCGACRILTMLAAIHFGLDFSHVTYSTSILGVLLYYCIATNDVVALFSERNRQKIYSSHESKPNYMCAYKYPFSNWYSKISFCWLTPILHLGYDTSLQSEHFGVLAPSEKAFPHCRHLQSTIFASIDKLSDRYSTNLWGCFTKCYWKTFVFGGCLKLIGDILGMVPPLGISVVVNYIEILRHNTTSTRNNLVSKASHITWSEFLQNGYVMAAVVLLMVLGQGTLSQNSTHIINVAGIRMKNALHGIIYQKLLKIRKNYSNEENACDNVGYVTNLITEDTYNIMSCFWIGNYIWAIPSKIIALIYLLYRVVGISAVIGSVTSILIMLIAQFIIGSQMSRNYESISDWSDRRLRRLNEILQGIRFIKLCGWEADFVDDANEIRKNELRRLNLDSVYWTVITFLANTSSIIIAVISLTLHYYLLEEPITSSCLFASLALFNQLTVPLFIFPVMLPIIVSAVVSAKRIEKFLSLPEITSSRKIETKANARVSDSLADGRYDDSLKRIECGDRGSIRLRKITENSENEEDGKARCDESAKNSSAVLKINELIVCWGDSSKVQLRIGDITIYRGTLNVVIGKEGSGKSSLLAALLDEMTRESGQIEWKRGVKVGYVPQTPWLLNGTLKRNIVFGSPFHEKHFLRVVQMCALKADINSMPDKENTVVGDGGMTLSGGQKQRVTIARMLYSKADVLLMDNPFSSLDRKITDYIFENGIEKLLSKGNKTIVMTTNFEKYLAYADQVIVMDNCRVKAVGTLADIRQTACKEIRGLTENTLENIRTSTDSETASSRNVAGFVPLGRRRSTLSGSRYFTRDLLLPTDDCEVGPATVAQKQPRRSRAATVTEYPRTPSAHRNVFRVSSLQTTHQQQRGHSPKKKSKVDADERPVFARHRSTVSEAADEFDRVVESDESDEGREWEAAVDTRPQKSAASLAVYARYAGSCGPFVVLLFFGFTFAWQILRVVADFWLSNAVSVARISDASHQKRVTPEVGWHSYSYILLSLFASAFSFFSTAVGQYGAAVARRRLHGRMLKNIFKCSPSFFDATPFAQIIDRFSTDTEITDKKISTSAQRLIQFQLLCVSAIAVNCFVTPWFIVVVIPISLVYYAVRRFYRCSSRKLQRLENVTKIPVVDHFSETFAGLEIIRALDRENSFTKTLMEKIDRHTNVFLISNSTNRWLGIMLDYLGGIIVSAAMFVSMISITLNPDLETSTFFGLAINYTLLIPIYLTWVVKFSNDLEIYMGAVDRICSYANIPSEDYKEKSAAPANWPIKGEIRFENVTLRYSSQGRSVIQNVNLRIDPGQKVGICGRTGSGKSSLMMSLLKMVPSVEGKIIFDDVDIDDVPLQLLRSKISVVSQDVILFGGSIRQNLDLRGEFDDEELWRSLKLVQIHEAVAFMGGLDARVQDGGSNLSVGERQSICLARAILRNASCLILDEATNALQPEAEIDFLDLVLKIFHNRTIIVITHRISSLLHFDRILVLNNGVLVEDGSPNDLASNKIGQFYSLLKITRDEPSVQRRFLF